MEQTSQDSPSHPPTNITHQPVMLGSASSHKRYATSKFAHSHATITKHVDLYFVEFCLFVQWFDRERNVGEKIKPLLTTSPRHNCNNRHTMKQQIQLNYQLYTRANNSI